LKKLVACLIAACFVLVGGSAFAATTGSNAVGLFGSIGDTTGVGPGLGLTAKFGHIPVGVRYNFSNPGSLGVSVDYHILDEQKLVESLDYYLGLGGFIGFNYGTDNNKFAFGGRIPVGLQLYPVHILEIYLGVVPLVYLLPTPNLGLGAELGVRVHF